MNRNIFVLFSPGLGGNHVANILSTDTNQFTIRFNDHTYLSSQKNAHTNYKNLQDVSKYDNIKNNILCGHWGEMYWLKIHNLIDKFKNRQVLILEIPKKDTLAYQRFIEHTKLQEYFIEEQRSIYSIELIQSSLNEKDFFVFPSEKIFAEDISEFLDFAKEEMNINVDRKLCYNIHKLWMSKIK